MVVLYRVDDRLLHGQVQIRWLGHYNTNRVIIVNDKTAEDPLAIQILKLAKPANVDLIITGERKGVLYLKKDAQQPDARTFVIFKTIETAWHMAQKGIEIKDLIVGPSSAKPDTEQMSKNTYFSKVEIGAAVNLGRSGCEITFQLVPDDVKTSWNSIKHKYGEEVK
jgi:PTS system mannose-specific IIB component